MALKGSRSAKNGNDEAENWHKLNETRTDMYKVNTGGAKFDLSYFCNRKWPANWILEHSKLNGKGNGMVLGRIARESGQGGPRRTSVFLLEK